MITESQIRDLTKRFVMGRDGIPIYSYNTGEMKEMVEYYISDVAKQVVLIDFYPNSPLATQLLFSCFQNVHDYYLRKFNK